MACPNHIRARRGPVFLGHLLRLEVRSGLTFVRSRSASGRADRVTLQKLFLQVIVRQSRSNTAWFVRVFTILGVLIQQLIRLRQVQQSRNQLGLGCFLTASLQKGPAGSIPPFWVLVSRRCLGLPFLVFSSLFFFSGAAAVGPGRRGRLLGWAGGLLLLPPFFMRGIRSMVV